MEGPPIPDERELQSVALGGVAVCAPLFAVALAGVESREENFRDQRSVIDDLLNLSGWATGRGRRFEDFPEALAFVFQGLHGALCLDTDQLAVALGLAMIKIPRPLEAESKSLFLCHEIMGWPWSLGRKCTMVWEFLTGAPQYITWLDGIFGSEREFRVALSAYYLALHVLELADVIARGKERILNEAEIRLDLPVCFLREADGIPGEAYRLLLRSHPEAIWESLKVSRSKMEECWPLWTSHAGSWLGQVYGVGRDIHMVHANLFQEAAR